MASWTVQATINDVVDTLPVTDELRVDQLGIDEHRYRRVRWYRDSTNEPATSWGVKEALRLILAATAVTDLHPHGAVIATDDRCRLASRTGIGGGIAAYSARDGQQHGRNGVAGRDPGTTAEHKDGG